MTDMQEMGKRAKKAAHSLLTCKTEAKNKALLAMAAALRAQTDAILAANACDVAAATEKGTKDALIDRLRLTGERVEAMASDMERVAGLPDPVGEVLEQFVRPNGIRITRQRVPMGVIGIIYESRPNVTADAASLCIKTANAVILKGGSDALSSNLAIVEALRTGLRAAGFPEDAVQLVKRQDRAAAAELMRLRGYVDLLIPRGGASLIRHTVENATVPVIETGTGNCHIYVDRAANLEKATAILLNAKTQRPGVCNAVETLLVHRDVAEAFLPMAGQSLALQGVEIRGCARTQALLDCRRATEDDFATEFLDLILAVRVVDSLAEATAHIERYSTLHSEAIITEDRAAAEEFLASVDAAAVYVNASTRFTDGGEFGFGAEIGISTQKLHARGPMGLRELTTYRYKIEGDGQIR